MTGKENMTHNNRGFGTKGWMVIVYTLVLYALSNVQTGIIQVSAPALAEIRHWDYASIMSLVTYGGWIGIPVTFAFAQLVKAKGVRLPTTIAMLVYGISMMFHGSASWLGYMAAAIVLSAVSNTINMVSPNTLIANWFPRKKGSVLGIATAGMMASSIFTTPVFAALTNGGGIEFAFNAFGVVLIVFAAITFFVRNTPQEAGTYPDNDPSFELKEPEAQAQSGSWSISQLLREKNFWFMTLGFGLGFFALVGSVSTLVPTCMQLGMDQPTAIKINMLCGVFAVIGSVLLGFLDQAKGTKLATNIYAVGMLAGMLMRGAGNKNTAIFVAGVMVFGFFQGALANLMISMTIQKFGARNYPGVNRIMSPLVVAIRMSSFLAIGAVVGASGYMAAGWMLCGVLAVSMLLLFAVDPTERQAP